jgi:hypothetical protein
MKLSEALKLRSIVEMSSASLDDKTASEGVSLFPRLKGDDSLVKAGTRINWNGIIKKATVDLWDIEANNPEYSPYLWEDIAYRDGIRIIPNTITVGTMFAKDELGWWQNEIYKSLVDANVYTPEQYSAWWEKQ